MTLLTSNSAYQTTPYYGDTHSMTLGSLTVSDIKIQKKPKSLVEYVFKVLDLRHDSERTKNLETANPLSTSDQRVMFQTYDLIVLAPGQNLKDTLILRFADRLSKIKDVEKMTIVVRQMDSQNIGE